MFRYLQLELDNGGSILITRPNLIEKVNGKYERIHDLVSVYMRLIMDKAIAIAKAENLDLDDEETADKRLFPVLILYYTKILELLRTGIVPDQLTRTSRHRFFVCGGLKEIDGGMAFEQSKLAWLLGHESRESSPQEEAIADDDSYEISTTGDISLDIMGRALVFLQKGEAISLWERLSPEEMISVMSYAGEILSKAMETDDDDKEAIVPEPDYDMSSEQVDELRKAGFELPAFSD